MPIAGRIETRTVTVIHDAAWLNHFLQRHGLAGAAGGGHR